MHPALSDDLDRLPELLQAARDFAVQEVSGLDGRCLDLDAAAGDTCPAG